MGLDRQAVEAVETWKFKPATLQGRPAEPWTSLERTWAWIPGSTTELSGSDERVDGGVRAELAGDADAELLVPGRS